MNNNEIIKIGMICYLATEDGVKEMEVTNNNLREIGNNWNITYFKDYKSAYNVYSSAIRFKNNIPYRV